jgi:hypothetical protein
VAAAAPEDRGKPLKPGTVTHVAQVLDVAIGTIVNISVDAVAVAVVATVFVIA